MLDTSYGFNNLLKEGHKHFSGFEEVVLKNIQACKEICAKIKRSYGPYGTPLTMQPSRKWWSTTSTRPS